MIRRTEYVDAPGAKLAVDLDGGRRPRVLLCHGGPGAPNDFSEVRADLASLGVPCARFDQRGVHRSVNLDGRWDLEAYASDVEAIRVALRVDRLVVFGHSWGGVVAQAWAQAHPDRVAGVLLASPSAAVGEAWPEMEAEVVAYLRHRVSPLAFAAVGLWSLLAKVPGRVGDRAMGEVYRRVLRAYTGESEAPDWVRHSSARAAHRTRAAMRHLPADVLDDLGLPPGVPARAAFGNRDIYGPFAARFAERHTDIETTFLPDCGHVLWHDAPEPWRAWLHEGLVASGVVEPSSG